LYMKAESDADGNCAIPLAGIDPLSLFD
jgi:hypothetical protein